jgi:regulator of cell morphogenesis and NO signaling
LIQINSSLSEPAYNSTIGWASPMIRGTIAENRSSKRKASSMSIQVNDKTTVRELVGQYPQTRKVFEQFGIDYCCGGGKCLLAAAQANRGDLSALLVAIEEAIAAPATAPAVAERDWCTAPLHELVDHILQVHHVYMKEALPKVNELARKVLHAHGAQHGDVLQRMYNLYQALDDELSGHLLKEEAILFPYIVAAEAHRNGASGNPAACFGSVEHPIHQMEHEHESAGQTLVEIRTVTGDYKLPEDACPTFGALYDELKRMEGDLHQHIHLENNILFPRAIAAESSRPSAVVKLSGGRTE